MAIQAHGKPTGSRAAVSVQPAPRIGLAFGVLNLRAHRTLADDRQGSINDRIIGGLVWGSAACPRSTPKYTANGCLKSTRSCLQFARIKEASTARWLSFSTREARQAGEANPTVPRRIYISKPEGRKDGTTPQRK
ncbi:hypothetical protein B0H14DRAFT_2594606 [Mycena olivaceomarginata]|nr:hypothetical protein B0H14DRAFT_2594606 [Mycena olivaceomarginata]